MSRMYFAAAHAADEVGKKTASAAVARMHIKAYDTDAVPQDKQNGTIFLDYIFHYNLQI